MGIDAISAGISGLRAAHVRQVNSASNVAKVATAGYRNQHTHRIDGAGIAAATPTQEAEPRPVNLVDEFVEQKLATVQSGASLRAIETALDLQKSLLDILV